MSGVAFALLLLDRTRGQRALEARLARLAARGEKLFIAELEPPARPPEKNIAIGLFTLTNQLNALTNRPPISLPSRRLAAPGRAIVSHRLNEWYPDPQRTNRWADVDERLANEAGLLESARTLIGRPYFNSGFDYHGRFQPVIAWLSPMSQLVRELNLQTLHALHRTNTEAAYQSLLAVLHLAAVLDSERLVICQLVRQPLAGIACNSTWEALQAGNLTEPQLAALQAAWERCDFIGDMVRSLEMERGMEIERFARMRGSRSELNVYVAQCDELNRTSDSALGEFVAHGAVRTYLQLPLWSWVWCYSDSLTMLDRWEHLLEQARLGVVKGWGGVEDRPAVSDLDWFEGLTHPHRVEGLSWFTRFRFPFSSQPSGLSEVVIRKSLLAQTQQQLTIAAIAIRRCQLVNQSLPATLSALVPRFVASVPRDRMNDGELHYRPLEDGTFSLYSVGTNLVDDGGDGAPGPINSSILLLTEGKDFVWPAPASPEEAAKFLVGARY